MLLLPPPPLPLMPLLLQLPPTLLLQLPQLLRLPQLPPLPLLLPPPPQPLLLPPPLLLLLLRSANAPTYPMLPLLQSQLAQFATKTKKGLPCQLHNSHRLVGAAA